MNESKTTTNLTELEKLKALKAELEQEESKTQKIVVEQGKPHAIKDLAELETLQKRLLEIEAERESKPTELDRKTYDIETEEERLEIMTKIKNGIPVSSNIPFKKEMITKLVLFFSKFGFSEDKIISKIEEVQFFVSDIYLGHNAKLVYTCNRVGIDIEYVDFLEDGTITFKPGQEDFFIHVVTHELLHKLSSEEAGKEFACGGDALIEGYTEMFNHYISGKTEINSTLYEFPERICLLFTEMIGLEKTVDDYINNNKSHPNLEQLFTDCGADFSSFRVSLSNILIQITKEKEKGITGCLALQQKIECLDFISNNILVPYCQQNLGEQTRLIERFNSLFSEFDYNLSLEEMNKDNKKT